MPTDKPMQLGMVGLGRMGAGIVRRLMADGHSCVGYDVSAEAVKAVEADGMTGLRIARAVRRRAREAAGRVGDGAGRRDHGPDDQGGRRRVRAGRHHHRRRQHPLPRRHPPRGGAARARHPSRRLRDQRRRMGAGARVLPDDRRRGRGRRAPRAALQTIAPASRRRRARPGRTARRATPSRASSTAARTARGTSSRWSTTGSSTA